MEIRQISYFDEFECLGADCPETCCRGWLIPLTDEDCTRYAQEHGMLKARLMLATSEHSIPVFNSSCGECTFHDKSGLCRLQLMRGHDFIPDTCRSYPRFYRNYGVLSERFLDLSCIRAASMLLDHASDMGCITLEGEADCEMTVTNTDYGYLHTLVDIRAQMISLVMQAGTPEELISAARMIDCYASDLQDAYLHGHEEYPAEHPFTEYAQEYGCKHGADSAREHNDNVRYIFPLSASEIDTLAHSSLYHDRLKKTNPTLYSLFKLYYGRYYRDLAAENGWKRAYTEFFDAHPETVPWFRAYLVCYLYEYWLKTFEDYSFVRHARIGMIHMSMLLLMEIIYEKKHGSLTKQEFALVCSVYNRRAYFSDALLDDMYRSIDCPQSGHFSGAFSAHYR